MRRILLSFWRSGLCDYLPGSPEQYAISASSSPEPWIEAFEPDIFEFRPISKSTGVVRHLFVGVGWR